MTLTNKYNLPESLVNACQSHVHKGGFLSASQTTKSVRQFWLKQRHADEITEDVSDRIWAMFGTAVHHVFEKNTENGIAEKYLETEILGKKVSGTSDLYQDGKITDYKTVSVWSIIYMSSLEEWTKQLNVYAYLYRKAGYEVNAIEIVALMRDWQKSKAHEDNYPPIQIKTIPIELWSDIEQELYLKQIVQRLIDHSTTQDDDLPLCTKEELWQDDDKYAIMKHGRKSAIRLLNSESDAQQYIENNKLDTKHYIEKRVGKPKRCEYCDVSAFCNQYKNIIGEKK